MTPTLSQYDAMMKSDLYCVMERYSDEWVRHTAHLNRWYPDPFHAWSRRWEYPWVGQRLIDSGAYLVLDAGCGFTFFPDWITSRGMRVMALDMDRGIIEALATVASPMVDPVKGRLENIPAPTEMIDAVVCISVLEHMTHEEWRGAIAEFHRVLVPGGLLLLTWDLSLDKDAHLTCCEEVALFDSLCEWFVQVPDDISGKPITTRDCHHLDPMAERLPHLSVVCTEWRKR